MKCTQFCTWPGRPTHVSLLKPPWKRKARIMYSGMPYSSPHYCSRLEKELTTESRIRFEKTTTYTKPSLSRLTHHLLCVQTAPRPNRDSLRSTLESIERAGLRNWRGPKIIMSDGYLPNALPPWQIFATSTTPSSNLTVPPTIGSAKTFVALLRKSLEIDQWLQYLTYLQDDVALCKNALDYVSRVEIPGDLSLVSWFCTDWHKPEFRLPALLGCRPTRFFIRSQAVTFTRAAIESMLYCHQVTNWPRLTACDAMPAWALGDLPYADHYPSIVQHTEGFNSACNLALQQHRIASDCPHSGARTSPSFPGEDFDALSLIP